MKLDSLTLWRSDLLRQSCQHFSYNWFARSVHIFLLLQLFFGRSTMNPHVPGICSVKNLDTMRCILMQDPSSYSSDLSCLWWNQRQDVDQYVARPISIRPSVAASTRDVAELSRSSRGQSSKVQARSCCFEDPMPWQKQDQLRLD